MSTLKIGDYIAFEDKDRRKKPIRYKGRIIAEYPKYYLIRTDNYITTVTKPVTEQRVFLQVGK